jgi:hypothetical protein
MDEFISMSSSDKASRQTILMLGGEETFKPEMLKKSLTEKLEIASWRRQPLSKSFKAVNPAAILLLSKQQPTTMQFFVTHIYGLDEELWPEAISIIKDHKLLRVQPRNTNRGPKLPNPTSSSPVVRIAPRDISPRTKKQNVSYRE